MQQLGWIRGWMILDNRITGVLAWPEKRGHSFRLRELGIIETDELGTHFIDEESFLECEVGTNAKKRLLNGEVVTL